MRQHSVRLFLSFLILILFTQACIMPPVGTPVVTLSPTVVPRNLYVSTSGRDSNNCSSLARACATLTRAFDVSTAGSTIHIGPGSFQESRPWTPYHSLNLVGAGVDQTNLLAYGGYGLRFGHEGTFTIQDLTIRGDDTENNFHDGIQADQNITLNLTNCRFTGNHNGIYAIFPTVTTSVSHCTFDGNGTAILINGGHLTLGDSSFTLNQTALLNRGSATVQNTTFDNNGAFDPTAHSGASTIINEDPGQLTMTGGGVSNGRFFGFDIRGGSVLLQQVNIHNNGNSGILRRQGGLEIRSSLITDNGSYGVEAERPSGVREGGRVLIQQTAIVRNGSAGLRVDDASVTLENVTISGNRADSIGDGGGIWMYGGNLFLFDTTVAYNTGHGLYANPGSTPALVAIFRSVVALNSAPCLVASAVHFNASPPDFVCNDSRSAVHLGLGPLAVDGGTLVHPLLVGSPLIDNPANAVGLCPVTDQRGIPRPIGPICDIGAYEFGTGHDLVYVSPTPAPLKVTTDTPTLIHILVPTPTETATAQPAAPLVTFVLNANCRKGPGTGYDVVDTPLKGMLLPAVGRSDDGFWWNVELLAGSRCWVNNSTVITSGPVDQLPLVKAPPLPGAPGNFADSTICNPKTGLSVKLSWDPAAGAGGYNLYRNGTLLTSLGKASAGYGDSAPTNLELTYALEAVNSYGHSGQVSLTIPACK